MSNVSIDRVAREITVQLDTFAKAVSDGVEKAAETTVKEMVQQTKQRRATKLSRGKYARSIASQVGESTLTARSRIWYVKTPRYRLTHLLNNGHAVRGGGHVSGDQHVTRAAEKAMTNFENRVREVVRDESD